MMTAGTALLLWPCPFTCGRLQDSLPCTHTVLHLLPRCLWVQIVTPVLVGSAVSDSAAGATVRVAIALQIAPQNNCECTTALSMHIAQLYRAVASPSGPCAASSAAWPSQQPCRRCNHALPIEIRAAPRYIYYIERVKRRWLNVSDRGR